MSKIASLTRKAIRFATDLHLWALARAVAVNAAKIVVLEAEVATAEFAAVEANAVADRAEQFAADTRVKLKTEQLTHKTLIVAANAEANSYRKGTSVA